QANWSKRRSPPKEKAHFLPMKYTQRTVGGRVLVRAPPRRYKSFRQADIECRSTGPRARFIEERPNMCDQEYFDKDREEYEARGLVTRKQFGAILGAGIAMMLPRAANAVTVTESDVNIKTPDGTADCYFVHPASATAPGVLIWPDIFGLRPAFRQMGKRLA